MSRVRSPNGIRSGWSGRNCSTSWRQSAAGRSALTPPRLSGTNSRAGLWPNLVSQSHRRMGSSSGTRPSGLIRASVLPSSESRERGATTHERRQNRRATAHTAPRGRAAGPQGPRTKDPAPRPHPRTGRGGAREGGLWRRLSPQLNDGLGQFFTVPLPPELNALPPAPKAADAKK